VRAASPLVTLAALLFAAGCGSGGGRERATPAAHAAPGTLNAILARPGEDVALVLGTEDYQPGPIRVSFLVVAHDGEPVFRPEARVWIGRGLARKPFGEATARLEDIGIPGESEPALGGVARIYAVRLRVPAAGEYFVVAEPVGGKAIQGVAQLRVKKQTASPPVGSKAIPANTPTIASTHGNFSLLTTRTPPDRELLRYSIADSLRTHVPFVVVFATPKFCTSRTCGPVVDVVDAVRRRFAGKRIRFIHVEVYRNNNPSLGFNRWFREWHLPSEPWTFLVGGDGRIKAKFEGSVGRAELEAAVRQYLAR
jgi:hypothetical protein